MATAARAKTAAATAARWLAPTRSVPSAFELESFIDLQRPPLRFLHDWAILACPIKKASGCGAHGQRVVDGLTLYARLLDSSASDLTSALYIQVNEDALRGMKAEFGLGYDGPLINIDEFRGFVADASVLATDKRFIFLDLDFRLREHGERKYYLIYDSSAASLSMVPCLPYDCPVSPLWMARGGAGDLAVLACRQVPPTPEEIEAVLDPMMPPGQMERMLEQMKGRKEDVVCVCSLLAPADEGCPWQVLSRNFPNQSLRDLFAVDLMFSFGGKAYWVDLAQGLVCCDWPQAQGVATVNFSFIALPPPPGCPADERWIQPRFEPSDVFPMTRDRTMAYVAGSIKFVCIDRSQPLGDVRISVWNLDPATSVWSICKQFKANHLWNLWSFKKEKLPAMEPRFPFLMEDGSLCLVIRNKPIKREDPPEDFICNVELPNLKVRWAGRLTKYHTNQYPIILPFDFFKVLHPLTQVPNLRGIFR